MMERDIFHECVCIGKKMTEEEWFQWLTSHPYDEIVHRCGEFGYNIEDDCVNPHKVIDFNDKYKNKFRIETCQVDNGKWSYGVSYWFGTKGGSHSASFKNATHDTEREAVYTALQEVEKKCANIIYEVLEYRETPGNEDDNKLNSRPYLLQLESIKNKIEKYKQKYDLIGKKYRLLENDTIIVGDSMLYRIEALKNFLDVNKGDKGGYIECEDNLSHKGKCWVFDDSRVFGNARLCNDAIVYGNSFVYDNALVCDNARVYGNACVCGNACILGNAQISNGMITDVRQE